MKDLDRRRREMVDRQIAARGVHDPAVLEAMRRVPRERFVPEALRADAFRDGPLPIGAGQTISQPYIVAAMVEAMALSPGDRVLEIGCGSGYAAAVLGAIAAEVVAVERVPELARMAARTLAAAGVSNVAVVTGDGSGGWPEGAPYDAILVSAAAAAVPEALLAQLAPGGRMVIPVGEEDDTQELRILRRRPDGALEETALFPVRFVPLVAGP